MHASCISQSSSRNQKHTPIEFWRNFNEGIIFKEAGRICEWTRDSKANTTSNLGKLLSPLGLQGRGIKARAGACVKGHTHHHTEALDEPN